MNNNIGNFENMNLEDSIVLNGKVDYINTHDDGDSTIGVASLTKRVTFKGEEIVSTDNGFALTKEMEEKINWGKDTYASVRFVTGDVAIDPTKVEETIIESYYGNVESKYYHRYSDYTGYLWTEEGFIVGGHDIRKILESHLGKYIHMEIEVYRAKK